MSFQELSAQEKNLLHGLFLRTRNDKKTIPYDELSHESIDTAEQEEILRQLIEKKYIVLTNGKKRKISITEKAEKFLYAYSFDCAYWQEMMDIYENWLPEIEYLFDEHISSCSACHTMFQAKDPYNSMLKAVTKKLPRKKPKKKK